MVCMPGRLQAFLVFFVHTLLSLLWGRGADADRPGGGSQTGGSYQCPRICFCNTPSKIVFCSRRGLHVIPSPIDPETLQLNLSGNMFRSTTLQRSNFSGLVRLEHIYMSECGIETIEVDTFRELVNLQWLDLSSNRIKVLQEHTFRGLNLRHLFLNGNRNIGLQPMSLAGLATTGLYLHECSLSSLDHRVLAPLNNSLQYMWLNGNELEYLDKHFAPIFSQLVHLRLGANPLHCNCMVSWLKDFYDAHPEIFEGADAPSCLTPHKLRGKFFEELTSRDLRCQPPVFGNIDVAFASNTQGRLKCSASGDPAPTIYWIQPSGAATKYPAPTSEEVKKTEGVLTIDGSSGIPHLAGMYICVANNDAGNVTLTINVSWPMNSLVTYQALPDAGVSTRTLTPLPSSSTRLPTPTVPTLIIRDDDDGDLVPQPSASASPSDRPRDPDIYDPMPPDGPGSNMTSSGEQGADVDSSSGQFNLSELIGAIIGTHLCTLILCCILIPLYFRRKYRSKMRHPNLEKPLPPPPETRYLNGLGHHPLSYMDLLPSKR